MSGQLGHPVRCHAEEEHVVKIDPAITQHQLTEEKFVLVLQIKKWKNVTVTNARVIFRCLKEQVKIYLKKV